MTIRRTTPFVVAAFLAAHITACACRTPEIRTARPASRESSGHDCCKKHGHPAPSAPQPAKSSCCCDDGSHFAVADGPESVTQMLHFVAWETPDSRSTGHEFLAAEFDHASPARGPDVPIFLLHSTLLI